MVKTLQLDATTTINRLGFGAMGISFGYGPADEEQGKATLRRSIEIGATFWDTARLYGWGANERVIGEVLKEDPEYRKKVFLVTKWGPTLVNGQIEIDGSAAACVAQFEQSVVDLGGIYPDAYLLHRVSDNAPIEESVEAMEKLRKEGKTRFIGLSECSASTLGRASKVAKIDFVEIEYSPWSLEIETNGLLSTARKLGIKIVAYSPLGRGFLTGRFKSYEDFKVEGDFRANLPRFATKEAFDKNYEIVKAFEEIAAKKGCKPSQLALAWLLAQGDDIIPIPGTKSEKYLVENTAANNVDLSPDEVAHLRTVIEANAPVGERYMAEHMAFVNK